MDDSVISLKNTTQKVALIEGFAKFPLEDTP